MLGRQSLDNILTKAKFHNKNGKITEAIELYQKALQSFSKSESFKENFSDLDLLKESKTPQHLLKEIINKLTNLYNQGHFSEVIQKAENFIKEYPNEYIVWNIIGAANIGLGQYEKASQALKKVIRLNPNYLNGLNNLGVVLKEQGKLKEAIEIFDKVISLEPNSSATYNNMGNIFHDLGQFSEALHAYKKAIYLNPKYADAYFNMGVVLKDIGEYEQAVVSYNKSLSLRPKHADTYYNLGNALQDQGKLEEAINVFKKSISLTPDNAEAHQNLGFALLNSGRLKEGLNENEWRWKTKKLSLRKRHFLQPLWDGKKRLNRKKILIWCEQGIGDTINWASCLPYISSKVEHCIFECQDKLVPLFKRSFKNIEVKSQDRSQDSERKDFDFHLPMGSLYKYFIKEISSNKKLSSYLIPDTKRVNFWKKRLNSLGDGCYVGISWKSSNMSRKRIQNYAKLSEFYPLFKIPNVIFINLQNKDFSEDLSKIENEFGILIHNFDELDHFDNIDDVAALCAALDVVVSTKTTVPLISSSVGTLTKLANWRQSPWSNILYNPVTSSADIFERDFYETWENTFCKIAKDVSELAQNWSSR